MEESRSPSESVFPSLSELGVTPGPWVGCNSMMGGCQCGYVFGHQGRVYVAQAIHEKNVSDGMPDPHPIFDCGMANAKLIAAAPDLYEALRRFVEISDLSGKVAEPWNVADGVEGTTCVEQARAALAKASGTTAPSGQNVEAQVNGSSTTAPSTAPLRDNALPSEEDDEGVKE